MMQLSPLGLVEKKTPGTYRIIHHLSFPEGSSINDGIPEKTLMSSMLPYKIQ